MARFPSPPDKQEFNEKIDALGELPSYYGKMVQVQNPGIDIKKLHNAVAKRTVYWEGYYALKALVDRIRNTPNVLA
jgi:hypothetical protein